MSNDNTVDINKHRKTDKEDYKAISTLGRDKETHLRAYTSSGDIHLYPYSALMHSFSVGENHLEMIFTHGVLLLEGVNLHALIDDLQDERIRCMHPFEQDRHAPPPADAPVIYRLEWQSIEQAMEPDE